MLALCSLALLLALRRPLPPRALWPQLVIAMLCVSILFPLFMAYGMQTVDASHGGVVLGVLPIATALVAVMITHERPRPLFWIASLAGAALVIAFALRQGGGAMSSGDLLLFLAVAVSADRLRLFRAADLEHAGLGGHQLDSRHRAADLDSGRAAHHAGRHHAVAGETPARPAYVTLFSQWIGFFAWNAGLAMGGIARVSQVQLLQPFVTFALAAFFNGETITWQIVAFAAAVVATVAISTRSRGRVTPPRWRAEAVASEPTRGVEPGRPALSKARLLMAATGMRHRRAGRRIALRGKGGVRALVLQPRISRP